MFFFFGNFWFLLRFRKAIVALPPRVAHNNSKLLRLQRVRSCSEIALKQVEFIIYIRIPLIIMCIWIYSSARMFASKILFSEWKSATNWTTTQSNWMFYSNRRSQRCDMKENLLSETRTTAAFPLATVTSYVAHNAYFVFVRWPRYSGKFLSECATNEQSVSDLFCVSVSI